LDTEARVEVTSEQKLVVLAKEVILMEGVAVLVLPVLLLLVAQQDVVWQSQASKLNS
jgi:hypothetical protein